MIVKRYPDRTNEDISQRLGTAAIVLQKEIDKKDKLKEFQDLTGKSKATFYRYKKFVEGKANTISSGNYRKPSPCYFCEDKKTIIFTPKPLCENCEAKLQFLYNLKQQKV